MSQFSLAQAVRRAVALAPERIAVIDGELRYTWRDFADRVARLAAVFRDAGLEPNGRVVVLALNSHWVIECFYAASHADGMIVPMNHRLSTTELAAQVADCAPDVIVFGPDFTHLAEPLAAATPTRPALFLAADASDSLRAIGEAMAVAEPIPEAGRAGDDLATLYYTSGTTSAAKGVMLSHANVAINSANVFPILGFDGAVVHLHHGPLFHTAAGARLFSVTQAAGTHVFLPRFETTSILDAIERHRATHLTVVPTMLRTLLDEPRFVAADLSSLRYLSYGGAPMPEPLLREAIDRLPGIRFVQCYGMTELSPVATVLDWRDHLPDAPAGRLTSVGRAAPFVEVAVVDDHGAPLPTGERGEIAVRGPTVMQGYWNRPDLTAAAIRDGWMLTGDIGRLDADGYLFLLDRKKDMIISGGENIYSLEVEQVLEAHPAVAQSAVFGRPDARWGEAVHAVVTLRAGLAATPDELVAHCRDRIAHYKCPRSVDIRLEPMPLSGANKIVKTVLREELLAREAAGA